MHKNQRSEIDMFRIKKSVLESALTASRELHPREFSGLLRQENGVITEILLVPATTFGEGFSQTRFDMIPIDRSVAGSIHSHPAENFKPSKQDLHYFGKIGKIHLIVKYPYGSPADIAAYDREGNRIELMVVD